MTADLEANAALKKKKSAGFKSKRNKGVGGTGSPASDSSGRNSARNSAIEKLPLAESRPSQEINVPRLSQQPTSPVESGDPAPTATLLGNGQDANDLEQKVMVIMDDELNGDAATGVTGANKQEDKTAGSGCCGFFWGMRRRILERVDEHRQTLDDNRPEVAMLVPVSEEEDEKILSPMYAVPFGTELIASASLRYYGKPCKLWVLHQDTKEGLQSVSPGMSLKAGGAEAQTPAEQLTAIADALESWQGKFMEDTMPWPLHEPRVCEALLARELEVLFLEAHGWFCSVISRTLHALRMFSPDEGGPVVNAFKDQYGEAAAFANVWAFFYAQALWILIPFVIVVLVLDLRPAATGAARVAFEVVKGGVLLWGTCIAILCSTRFLGDYSLKELERAREGRFRTTMKLTRSSTRQFSSSGRRLRLIFLALPSLVLFAICCMFTLLMCTNLILHIIFVWGDCYNLHTPEEPCRDATKTHGIWGWAAEVGCDVGLAILFELFFAISAALSTWIADLLNFEFESDHQYFQSMLEVFLSALERIGFVGSLAFAFVPQWEEPHGLNTIDMSIGCSDLFMGESSYLCMQRRLPLEFRRWLLEKLMKGPFMVAPFIAILIKTIIPYVVYKLHQACDYCIRCPGRCICLAPLRFIIRFFTLIFTLEGDNVGCFKFAYKGWPFSDVSLDPPPNSQEAQPLKEYKKGVLSLLDQGILKPFEPDDELMELEMSFLWVLFFTPLKPFGVITTLIAKIMEINFDMIKMLHVRRRSFPKSDKIMRREQTSFVNAVLLGSFGWTAGLSLITYNDDLHKWGIGGVLVLVGMMLWLVFCACLGFSQRLMSGCAIAYANLVDFQKRRRKRRRKTDTE